MSRASAGKREVEILASQVKSLKSQVQSLQELLANREQDHRYVISKYLSFLSSHCVKFLFCHLM